MSKQSLTDRHGMTIGYLEILNDGRHRMTDSHGNLVGYFDPRQNRTVDAHGNNVGQGDLLAMLLPRPKGT